MPSYAIKKNNDEVKVIKCKLSTIGTIKASLVKPKTISASMNITNTYDAYTGVTTVTPSVRKQVLNTKHKVMPNDVTVKEIPTYEVSNQFGTTFYIAKELDE